MLGLVNAPEIYTAAVGLYIIWMVTRMCIFVFPYASHGMSHLAVQLLSWIVIGIKCVIAGLVLFIIIPLCVGYLADMLFFCPIRVPIHKTPIFYPTTVGYSYYLITYWNHITETLSSLVQSVQTT